MKFSHETINQSQILLTKLMRFHRIGWMLVILVTIIVIELKQTSYVEPMIIIAVLWTISRILFEGIMSLCFIFYDKNFEG